MPVGDVETPGSPGWWMARLWGRLQAEQKRFDRLQAYHVGRPPLPWGSDDSRSSFYRFQATARSNFAAVIVQAPCERIGLRSISTAVVQDEEGDSRAWQLAKATDLPGVIASLARLSFRFGVAYVSCAMPDESGFSVIAAEDPRQVVTASDPMRPSRVRAAFKLYHDDEAGTDVAILWLPGRKWVATRQRRVTGSVPAVMFSPESFTMRPVLEPGETGDGGLYSEEYTEQVVPVRPVFNREGYGEFELHTDLLDRINHMILQRIVIATLQAFRQRAIEVEEDLPDRDEDGKVIDYADLFAADPGALWKLPKGAKIWESGQVDLSGVLASVKDDVLHLAALTRTPLSMFTPDAATQTAEGASLQREGLTFKVEDWERNAEAALSQVVALAFRFMGDDVRADVSQIGFDWAPAERYSLAEQGSAAAGAGASLTWEQQQRIIWQQTPQQIAEAKAQRADDMVLAQAMAAVRAARPTLALPPVAPPPVNGGVG